MTRPAIMGERRMREANVQPGHQNAPGSQNRHYINLA